MALSVAVATLGCKVNQAESEELCSRLAARGCHLADFEGQAQVYVVNTCTVTHVADRKSRNLVQRARRANPSAPILVAGCYAERAGRELAALPGVWVVGQTDKVQVLEDLCCGGQARVEEALPWPGHRGRALVKVQDGCGRSCTYCVVPLVRGRPRSLPQGQAVAAVEERVAAGYREVVLTGVDLGWYGTEFGGSLAGLLHRVLETGVQRLRLSSLHPQDIQPALLELWSDVRLCHHFHLALQSGSAGVLRRMGRGYSPAQYRAAVGGIRGTLPEAALTTDVMVGFPGETQEEFEESYRFCREMAFARMHVFRFSARPGTAACCLGAGVPARIKAGRSEAMRWLGEESAVAFASSFVGRTLEVLFEGPVKGLPNRWRGLTGNYLEVEADSALPLAGHSRLVRIVGGEGRVLQGTVQHRDGY